MKIIINAIISIKHKQNNYYIEKKNFQDNKLN